MRVRAKLRCRTFIRRGGLGADSDVHYRLTVSGRDKQRSTWKLPNKVWNAWTVALVVMGFAITTTVANVALVEGLLSSLVGLLLTGLVATPLIAGIHLFTRQKVTVGVDGVWLLEGVKTRFIAYEEIASIERIPPQEPRVTGKNSWWRVVLTLM